jgi:hypothetical protein
MKARLLILTCTIESDQSIRDLKDGIVVRFDPGFGELENVAFTDLKIFDPKKGPKPTKGGKK